MTYPAGSGANAPPFAPGATQILSGSVTSATTLITIPAGMTWVGQVIIQGNILVASAGAAITGSVTVSTTGTGVVPAAGVVARMDLASPASAAASVGTGAYGSVDIPVTVVNPNQPATGTSCTLTVAATNMNTYGVIANGVLL